MSPITWLTQVIWLFIFAYPSFPNFKGRIYESYGKENI